MRGGAGWVAPAVLIGVALFPALSIGETAGPGGTPELKINARTVQITPLRLDGLRMRGAVSLNAGHPRFGGFSGLMMDDGHLIAVSDAGWWLLADMLDGPDGLKPFNAGYAPIRDEEGEPLRSSAGDAEGLSRRDGNLVVSFERDHRIMFHFEDGQLGDPIRDVAFDDLSWNKGLEALATSPDGWLLAITEAQRNGAHRMFSVRYSGKVIERSLPATGRFLVTGADVGPDGRIYLLLRDFRRLIGVKIQIHRFELDDEGFPRPETRQVLAEFENAGGIDNMEGIALWQDTGGVTHLTMISDDNFSAFQRTLIVDLEVLD